MRNGEDIKHIIRSARLSTPISMCGEPLADAIGAIFSVIAFVMTTVAFTYLYFYYMPQGYISSTFSAHASGQSFSDAQIRFMENVSIGMSAIYAVLMKLFFLVVYGVYLESSADNDYGGKFFIATFSVMAFGNIINIINLIANKGTPDDKASFYVDSLNFLQVDVNTSLGSFLSAIYVDVIIATAITAYYYIKFVHKKTIVKATLPYLPTALMIICAVVYYIKTS